MDRNKRQRGVYVTARQKKKLIELMAKHPELISCRVTQDFNYRDSQQLWHSIANECNSIPGAKKSWRQWRKTWQDLRSKTKKRQAETNGELPNSVVMLTPAEQEALGLKNVSSTTNQSTEFIPLEDQNDQDSFDNIVESNPSYSDAESFPEEKVFTNPDPPEVKMKKHKNNTKLNSKHTTTCAFNCDMLAVQEQRKIQIKEDYLNFKKDYLRQKLKLLKEQTEALKSIAKELCVNK
nr:myb/SANT-like DNA-binding domain-containing protein 3 [Helicoverpa armigera]